jgi:hypothetical protein
MGGKASILLVMGFSLVLGYISMNLNRYSTQAVSNMTSYYDATASHNLALAGANSGLSEIYQDTSWTGPMHQTLSEGALPGSFTVTVADLGAFRKRLRSVSTYAASTGETFHDTVEVFFNTKTGSPLTLYAWFTNNDGNVFWQNEDTVWGRAHSNGNVHIAGSPAFVDKFTTAKKFDPPKPGEGSNQAKFLNGYETGVAEIPFPSDISTTVAAATSGGKRYTHDISVTLLPGSAANNDGMAAVVDLFTGARDTVQLGDAGFNGVILGDGNVSVRGTLDGRLSVASLKNISVVDDLLYERNPRTTTSDDMLGLIATNNVVIADNTPNHTSCVVNGAIFTLTGSVVAENLGSIPVCGNLTIYGSVIQNQEQEVGLYKAKGGGKSSLTSGFWKDFRYDNRLMDANNSPPYFPGATNRTYAITNWWESYRISYAR